MSLQEWLRTANKLAKEGKSKPQIIELIGEPPGKITSNGRGGWKNRTGDRAGQRARRAKFDTTSTPLAANGAKNLEIKKQGINGKASMYGLEPMQTEHLYNQQSAREIDFGAAGDPDKKLLVKQSDARFKDAVEQATKNTHRAVVNPAENAIKAVPKKYFDPIADPNLLPGTNLRNLQDLAEFVARGSGRSLMSALPVVGIAAGGLEAKSRTEKAMQTGNPLDQMQAGFAVGGQFPGAGNALDMLNFVVDMVRNPTAFTPQARYLQQSRNLLPYGR
jgi:hypothetical protein|tara:strand:+ start:25180 stop:26007 length:828 start_codon:yes stop_codon:yes gene_type:complete